jgi:polyhydroxyalkanoate synthase
LQHQRKTDGSWWDDWVAWLDERCGANVAARRPGNKPYSVIARAPGTYVHEM